MIIGIGGISRGGKSNLAKLIKEAFTYKKVVILHQDDYIFPKNQIPRIRNHIDWESPSSIDFNSFHKAVKEAEKTVDIVISEGLFAFYDKTLNDSYTARFLVEIPKNEFVKRKKRDIRWGREEDWYIEHIWQSYLYFGKPNKNEFIPYFYVDGMNKINIDEVISRIKF